MKNQPISSPFRLIYRRLSPLDGPVALTHYSELKGSGVFGWWQAAFIDKLSE
jgi:hypothetical protein